jgi:hypothetical protein
VAIAVPKTRTIPAYAAGGVIFSANITRPAISIIGHNNDAKITLKTGAKELDAMRNPFVVLEILSEN